MDGNNRWSKNNNISKYDSYKMGANKLIEISNYIFQNYDINYVSAFALSTHNFKRGTSLINIIKRIILDFIDTNHDNNYKFRIKFKGNLNFLPKNYIKNIKKFENINTKSKNTLLIYLNYSGREDIYNASKNLKKLNNYNHNIFQNCLSSGGIPDPDMLIRTGGYKRISDFMLYQLSFTELFFMNKLWPNIKNTDVRKYINQFNLIDRKFGN
tara:strand:+ start:271 stop:906 length:636 start_codon:yes stop_codon:yes gene_type:complete